MKAFILFDSLFDDRRVTHVAVVYEHREVTYDELRREVLHAAEVLNSINIRAGDRVALLLQDSPEFIAAFVAIISLGVIAVPINMGLSRAEQRFILRDCGARAAIVEAEACTALFEESIQTADGLKDDSSLPQLEDLLIVQRSEDVMAFDFVGLRSQFWASAIRKSWMDGFNAEDAEYFAEERKGRPFSVRTDADSPAF